jgi:hypothetical protein
MKNDRTAGLADPAFREIQRAVGRVPGKAANPLHTFKSGETVEVTQTSPLFRYMIP